MKHKIIIVVVLALMINYATATTLEATGLQGSCNNSSGTCSLEGTSIPVGGIVAVNSHTIGLIQFDNVPNGTRVYNISCYKGDSSGTDIGDYEMYYLDRGREIRITDTWVSNPCPLGDCSAYGYKIDTVEINPSEQGWYVFDFATPVIMDNDNASFGVRLESTANNSSIQFETDKENNDGCEMFYITATCTTDANCEAGEFCNEKTEVCEKQTADSYDLYRGKNTSTLTLQNQYFLPTEMYDWWVSSLNNYSYQVFGYEGADIVGKSNIPSLVYLHCTTDEICAVNYGEGYYCNSESICTNLNCLADVDCNSGEYCDVYTSLYFGNCRSQLGQGGLCTHDNMCTSDDCLDPSATSTGCVWDDLEFWESCAYPVGICEKDGDFTDGGQCQNFGTCFDVAEVCTHDENCTATEYCTVVTEGADDNTSFCESPVLDQPWDYCARDSWCGGTSYGGLDNESMACDDNLCNPDSWGCNWDGDGCVGGSYCNWSENQNYGDHECYTVTSGGGDCTTDAECAGGQCLGGYCTESTSECIWNNPDKYGNTNDNRALDGYCEGDNSNQSAQWCYLDVLSESLGYPTNPDKECWYRLGLGYECDYAYQCDSLNCGYAGGSQVCIEPLLPNESGLWSIDSELTGCTDIGTSIQCPTNSDVSINVDYENNGVHYSGADCVVSSSGFSESEITMLDAGYRYYAQATAINATGSYYYRVTCSVSGEDDSLLSTGAIPYTIGFDNVTKIVWLNPFNNETQIYASGYNVKFKVQYFNIGNEVLEGATCGVKVEGAGTYYYNASCALATYEGASASGKFWILHNHCSNDIRDGDETGVDCGGSCPPCETSDCDDGIQNGAETGIDCGGSCDACSVSDCDNGIIDGSETGVDCGGNCPSSCCTSLPNTPPNCGTCTDLITNGNEWDDDCGGRCYEDFGLIGACNCGINNDCSDDGSYYCNTTIDTTFGFCKPSTCSGDADCNTLEWRGDGGADYMRDRVCNTNTGLCVFGEDNTSDISIQLNIQPLSGLPMYNDTWFIGNCEAGLTTGSTNGFIVTTGIPTTKKYKLIASPYSPNISASTNWFSFHFLGRTCATPSLCVPTTGVTSIIPEICPSDGQDYIYSRLTMRADSGSLRDFQTVDALMFADAFVVNQTLNNGTSLNFTSNRNANCYWKDRAGNSYTIIGDADYNETSFTLNFENATSATAIWYCNTTYGESVTDTWRSNPWNILIYTGGEVLGGMTGGSFQYFGWMIIPIIFIMGIIVPLIIVFAIRKNEKRP